MSNHTKSQQLTKVICDRLAESSHQRLTFAKYMDLVLYHPQYGYYTSQKAPIGVSGDFFTSSSLGKDFGELLAIQSAEIWDIMGKPQPFTIIEMGAGTGAMAVDILQYLEEHYFDLFAVTNYTIIEQSNSLRERQQQELKSRLTNLPNLSWKFWDEIGRAHV